MSVSTHVLDAARGRPAVGVPVRLEEPGGAAEAVLTDGDGRASFGGGSAGTHRIVFDTGAWFAATGTTGFYPEVVVTFAVTDAAAHHHVPLLLSPYAYSTYRGS